MNNEFFIWEGVFENFKNAQDYADGFGFSGETYNSRAYDAAKECLISLKSNIPIPFFHKQRSVMLPPIASMMLNQKSSTFLKYGIPIKKGGLLWQKISQLFMSIFQILYTRINNEKKKRA